MYNYPVLLGDVRQLGTFHEDRTGVGCIKLFGHHVVYNVLEFPFSLQRPMGIKNAWEEMKFFLSGNTDTKALEEKGINFWRGNTSREFLDNHGLHHLPEGSLGSAYSKQFRSALQAEELHGVYVAAYVDQVQELIDGLKYDPYSRRHAIDLWGLAEQSEMPLLPCWWRSNWAVQNSRSGQKYLNLALYSRSCDLLLGYYQATMQYRLFQIALAKMLGYEVGNMHVFLWDVHIYTNQLDYVDELLQRKKGEGGKVTLDRPVHSLDDILELDHTDFTIVGYEPNREPMTTPRPPMVV